MRGRDVLESVLEERFIKDVMFKLARERGVKTEDGDEVKSVCDLERIELEIFKELLREAEACLEEEKKRRGGSLLSEDEAKRVEEGVVYII
ncbi:MAG: hypothetical protein QXT86_09635 [Archaeoglobaceae archaeon]